MSLLNKELYKVGFDSLIYDNSHQVDGGVVRINVPAETEGVLVKGQLIDYANGEYNIHTNDGKPCVVVAEDTPYAKEDQSIPAQVYTSGTLCANKIVCDPELSVKDYEELKSKNIYLK